MAAPLVIDDADRISIGIIILGASDIDVCGAWLVGPHRTTMEKRSE